MEYQRKIFLQPEIRCGTYIGTEMKKVWYVELQMLELFINICSKYNLEYQMVGGSLLGAMRHQGFIPWDDDIDVGMPRKDYDKFVKVSQRELIAPYCLQTPLTDPGRNIDYVQIRKSDTAAIDLRYIEEHYTFNQGIFIDIFPIDAVGDDETLKKQEKQMQFLRRLYTSTFKKNASGLSVVKHYVSKLIYCAVGGRRFEHIRNNIFRKVNSDNCKELGLVSFLFNNNRRNYWDRKWVAHTIEVPFEYLSVSVPHAFDRVLTKTYGNWKEYVKGGAMHGGLDFNADISYKILLKNKYGYKEFGGGAEQSSISSHVVAISGVWGGLASLSPTDGIDVFQMLQTIGKGENDFKNDVYGMTYEQYKDWLMVQFDIANGKKLPDGYVPQSIYWLYINGKPAGIGKIRWGLTTSSREVGGNLGYAIAESYRGNGYGTILFNTLVNIAKAGHCDEILATVNKDNYASKCVMEKCDGRLIRENDLRWYYSFD